MEYRTLGRSGLRMSHPHGNRPHPYRQYVVPGIGNRRIRPAGDNCSSIVQNHEEVMLARLWVTDLNGPLEVQ